MTQPWLFLLVGTSVCVSSTVAGVRVSEASVTSAFVAPVAGGQLTVTG